MCGIYGELRFDGGAPDLTALGQALAQLRRRGPDHEGIFSDGPVVLGHRRLSIVDLSDRANQPLVDHKQGLAVIVNGSIYNYRELRSELERQGCVFFSNGDSEVVLRAFAFWGEAAFERLSGIFALAVWNIRRQLLYLVRDPVGVKPLYFSADRKRLRFASTVQALLASGGVDTEIDRVALHHQLTLHGVVPAPRTILAGVRKLEPGTALRIDTQARRTLHRYWALPVEGEPGVKSEEEWQDGIHQALLRAVERCNRTADVPVGVLLSGGLDSSLLVALLAETGASDIKTFSVGFEDQPEERGSEFEYSDLVVERFNTDHYQYRIRDGELLRRLPEAVGAMSEPMVGQDAVAFYLLAEQVSQEVKVVQCGQGADEVFAGYFWYSAMKDARGSHLDRFARHYFDRDHRDYLASVTRPYRGADYTSEKIRSRLASPGPNSLLERVLRLELTTLIEDPVRRVDNMTMAWGLEGRVPFLDQDVVSLASRLPVCSKLADGGKGVLRRIARDRIPKANIRRPKGYFPVPALKFVRGEFLNFMR
jgi:asparagine synthase (glutamine-hydrolysing)